MNTETAVRNPNHGTQAFPRYILHDRRIIVEKPDWATFAKLMPCPDGMGGTGAELKYAAELVRCANAYDDLVAALEGLTYWSERINALQHAGNTIKHSSWSELFDATNRARAALDAAGVTP
jgi:hypothetical protein